MPRIFHIAADDPLISGIRGGNASAASAIQFRRQKLADERAQKALELRERSLDQEIQQRSQALEIKRQQAAMEQQQTQLAAIAGQGDLAGMRERVAPPGALGPGVEGPLPEDVDRLTAQQEEFAQRLERDMQLLPGLSEPAQQHLLKRRQQEEQDLAVRQGFEAEAGELADALEDGLFEGQEEVAQELAQTIQEIQAGGGKPGKVSEVIRKHRRRAAEEQVVQQEWAEAHQTAETYLAAAKSPEQKRKLQLEIIQNQAPSVQKKRNPELFLNRLREIALDESSSQDLRDVALQGTQFAPQAPPSAPPLSPEQEAQHMAMKAQERGARGFPGRTLQPTEENFLAPVEQRGWSDLGSSRQNKFLEDVEKLKAGKLTDGVKRSGNVERQVQPSTEAYLELLDKYRVDVDTIPELVKKKMIRALARE